MSPLLDIALVFLLILCLAFAGRFIALAIWRVFSHGARRVASPLERLRDRSATSTPLQRLRQRWPRATGFIGARIGTGRFDGLPLTLLILAGLYAIFLLAGLIEEVLESDEIVAADALVFSFIEPLRSDAALAAFSWITRFGDGQALTAVTLVTSMMLAIHGPRRYIAPLWISTVGAQVTSWAGKYVFDRARPDFIVDIGTDSPSFPSGHTTGAVSVYLLVAYILARDLPDSTRRFDIAYVLAVVVFLVALSRLILGVHYPSDIAGGLLVGAFWWLVAVAVAELRNGGTTGTRPHPGSAL